MREPKTNGLRKVIYSALLISLIVSTASGQWSETPTRKAESRKEKSIQSRLDALESRVKALEERLGGESAAGEITRSNLLPEETPMQVRFVGKKFREGNLLNGEVGDRIVLDLEFKSKLKKPIRAFTGVVVFRDVFDREVLRTAVTCSCMRNIRPGRTVRWSGFLRYQQFDENHRRLRNLELAELKTSFILERVIYEDGSRAVFAEPEETKSVQNKLIPVTKRPTPKASPAVGQQRQGGNPPPSETIPTPSGAAAEPS